MSPFGELHQSVAALNRAMSQTESLEETLDRIAEIARSSIPGCDAVGVTLRADGHAETAAFAGEIAQLLDQAQYDDDKGPCLEAYRTNSVVFVDDMAAVESQWPTFVATAQKVDVTASLSLPLLLDDEPLGALNLYATAPDAFDGDVPEYAQLLALQAAVALTNAAIYWRTFELTQNLNVALESRDIIGQAKGVLMVRRSLPADEAFELLRSTSQQRNIKVRALAEQVALTGDLPAV